MVDSAALNSGDAKRNVGEASVPWSWYACQGRPDAFDDSLGVRISGAEGEWVVSRFTHVED